MRRLFFVPKVPSHSEGRNAQRGFSLFELLIYSGILAITVVAFSGVLITSTEVQVSEKAGAEVDQQSQFVLQTVQRLVRDASLIELAANTATSTLRLRMASSTIDPTLIYLSTSTSPIGIYLQQGSGAAAALTNTRVVANSLDFTKRANPPGKDIVQVNFTLTYNSSNPRQAIARTIESAIAKVSAATFDSDVIPSSDNQYDLGGTGSRWVDGFFSNNITIGNLLNISGQSSDPSNATSGSLYFNTASSTFRGYNGSLWLRLLDTTQLVASKNITITNANASTTIASPIKRSCSFTIESPTNAEDDAVCIFDATSTINTIWHTQKASKDTIKFNLAYDNSRVTATSSATLVWTAYQTGMGTTTASTTTTFTNATVNTGQIMRLSTTAASSSQFHIDIYYTENQ